MELIVANGILDYEPPTRANIEKALSNTMHYIAKRNYKNRDILVSIKSINTDPETIRERITNWETTIQNKLKEQRRKTLRFPRIKSIRDLIVATRDARNDWSPNSNYGILFQGMIADKDYRIEAPEPFTIVSPDEVIHEEISRHPDRYLLVTCTMKKRKTKNK